MILWLTLALADPEEETQEPDPTEETTEEEEPEEVEPPPPTGEVKKSVSGTTYVVEEEAVELPSMPTKLPSAIDAVDMKNVDAEGLANLEALGLSSDDFARPTMVRGQWFFRPTFAWSGVKDEGSAVETGLTAGRRWNTIEQLPLQFTAQSALSVAGPIGSNTGRRMEFRNTLGPWVGPVLLMGGAGLRWDKERWSEELTLEDAWHVDFPLSATLDLGGFSLLGGVTPSIRVAGERLEPVDSKLPLLGDETGYRAGIGVPLKWVGLFFDGSIRETEIGQVKRVGLAVQLTLGG